METLYELARLCSKHKRMLEALIPGDEKSPLNKLYKITCTEGDEITDVECMMSIYGKKRVSAFSRLKSRLRDVFYHVIILTSTSSISLDVRSREFLENFRQTLIARSLVQRRSAKLSTDIIEKSIVKSMRYHVTENVLEQSRMLIAYYNGAMYNKYKLKKYQEIQSQYLEIYKWEIKSENYYLDLQRDQFQSLATPTQEMKNKAYRYYSDLKNAEGIRSYFFN